MKTVNWLFLLIIILGCITSFNLFADKLDSFRLSKYSYDVQERKYIESYEVVSMNDKSYLLEFKVPSVKFNDNHSVKSVAFKQTLIKQVVASIESCGELEVKGCIEVKIFDVLDEHINKTSNMIKSNHQSVKPITFKFYLKEEVWEYNRYGLEWKGNKNSHGYKLLPVDGDFVDAIYFFALI
ncbi:hypothetical protein [Paraferrimonas sp. SM1919]|uniref:hypothetical protein n=1 Tax=Paraferrimonas sp. SM1919 TaxID=2662263 RepID=UPI0013D5587C|nr:hypothetical protein [Paraferrimonas sp. SM1919]